MNFLASLVSNYYQDVDGFIEHHQKNSLSKSDFNKLREFLREEKYRIMYNKITDLSLFEIGDSLLIKKICQGGFHPYYSAYVRAKQGDGGLYVHCRDLGPLEGTYFSLCKSDEIICLNYDLQQPIEVFRQK